MVDMVVHRHELRATLANLCRLLTRSGPAPLRNAPPPLPAPAPAQA
jgi:acetyl-CoA carboxylase carboxyl transferase subunit beta